LNRSISDKQRGIEGCINTHTVSTVTLFVVVWWQEIGEPRSGDTGQHMTEYLVYEPCSPVTPGTLVSLLGNLSALDPIPLAFLEASGLTCPV
jgi:hypothetical protein